MKRSRKSRGDVERVSGKVEQKYRVGEKLGKQCKVDGKVGDECKTGQPTY